uniref:Large ribosomal subunit protein bL32c n=1 Tax=Lathyrus pseudocicera TaxID=1499328 RepID=A0A7R6RBA0_9FABA|nr:ribosomal protein L32 [Lathyrus pseudocicera]
MPVPKKRTFISKKKIRKNFWKKKGYTAALKAFSLAESIFTGNSKSFFCKKTKMLDWNTMN